MWYNYVYGGRDFGRGVNIISERVPMVVQDNGYANILKFTSDAIDGLFMGQSIVVNLSS